TINVSGRAESPEKSSLAEAGKNAVLTDAIKNTLHQVIAACTTSAGDRLGSQEKQPPNELPTREIVRSIDANKRLGHVFVAKSTSKECTTLGKMESVGYTREISCATRRSHPQTNWPPGRVSDR